LELDRRGGHPAADVEHLETWLKPAQLEELLSCPPASRMHDPLPKKGEEGVGVELPHLHRVERLCCNHGNLLSSL
jgi:hypothetical protein